MEITSGSQHYSTTIVHNLVIFLLWIGFWGLSDNIINIFIPYTNYYARIVIYFIIVLVSFLLIYLLF